MKEQMNLLEAEEMLWVKGGGGSDPNPIVNDGDADGLTGND